MSEVKTSAPKLGVIHTLLNRAAECRDAGEAMKYTQAALNAAHVQVALEQNGLLDRAI